MPTTKPRLNVTMRPQLYATIKRLAQLQGRSMSRTLTDLLEVTEPALQSVVHAIEAVRHLEGESRTHMLANVLRQLDQVEHLASNVGGVNQADLFHRLGNKVLETEEKGKGAKRATKPVKAGKRAKRK